MSVAVPFLYFPLEGSDTIRLLIIEDKWPSDSSTGSIRCTIQQFSFTHAPPFRALSYAWGDHDTKQIFLNGCPMQIRTNLWNALANLRLTGYGVRSPRLKGATPSGSARTLGRLGFIEGRMPTKSSDRVKEGFSCGPQEQLMNVARRVTKKNTNWIWIDALCINQNDIEERNHQVHLMGQIYAKATEVLVWLGCQQSHPLRSRDIIRAMEGLAEISIAGIREEATMARMRHSIQDGLLHLLKLPYWGRMWIVQEIGLAKKVTLLFDVYSADWAGLRKARRFVAALPSITEDDKYRYYTDLLLKNITAQRDLILDSQAFTLDQHRLDRRRNNLDMLIRACQNSICSDPRDKVYALLGLATDCMDIQFPVDYSKTIFEVYNDVIEFYYISQPPWVDTVAEQVVSFSHILQGSLNCAGEMEQDALSYLRARKAMDTHLAWGFQSGRVSAVGIPLVQTVFPRGPNPDFLHCNYITGDILYGHLGNTITKESYGLYESQPNKQAPSQQELDLWHHRKPSKKDGPKWIPFVASDGRKGYGPSDTCQEDILCSFLDCEVVVVLRPVGPNPGDRWLGIVGRAFMVKSTLGRRPAKPLWTVSGCLSDTKTTSEETPPPEKIILHLSAVTLQQLTS